MELPRKPRMSSVAGSITTKSSTEKIVNIVELGGVEAEVPEEPSEARKDVEKVEAPPTESTTSYAETTSTAKERKEVSDSDSKRLSKRYDIWE